MLKSLVMLYDTLYGCEFLLKSGSGPKAHVTYWIILSDFREIFIVTYPILYEPSSYQPFFSRKHVACPVRLILVVESINFDH